VSDKFSASCAPVLFSCNMKEDSVVAEFGKFSRHLGYTFVAMRKYLAAVMLLVGLTVYVSIKDEHAAEQSASPSASRSKDGIIAKNYTNDGEAEVPDAERNAPSWYGFFRWPNGTTVWAIILTLLAIAEQTKETRRATNSQRDKDRARLSIAPGYGDGFVNFDHPSPLEGLSTLCIEVTQHGPTKAFNVHGFAVIKVENTKTPKSFPNKHMPRMDMPDVIEPSQVLTKAMTTFWNIDDAALNKVRNEKAFIHFFGFVSYEDVFEDRHRSSFRYIWIPETRFEVPGEPGEWHTAESGGWQVHGRKKDNRAT
jgi:hypothetical protein